MGRALHQNRTPKNIPIRVAAVLFCLTLLSVYLVTGLFARYSTTAQSSDQARVAAFSIQGGGALSKTIKAEVAPNGSGTVTLAIHNKSEVAVEYTIVVDNETNNLPLKFALTKTDATSTTPNPVANENSTTFTAQQIPGDHTDKYTLTINWPKETTDDLALMGMVDHVTVTVTATQID